MIISLTKPFTSDFTSSSEIISFLISWDKLLNVKTYLGILSLWGVLAIIIGVILIIPKVRQSIKIGKMRRKYV